jgi:hypothetical protein
MHFSAIYLSFSVINIAMQCITLVLAGLFIYSPLEELYPIPQGKPRKYSLQASRIHWNYSCFSLCIPALSHIENYHCFVDSLLQPLVFSEISL